MRRAYIGIGANLGDPSAQLWDAISRLPQPQLFLRRRARVYASPPIGPPDQPDYQNTVVEIDTELAPTDLLGACQQIERDMGRRRIRHWGERLIDLDVLLIDDLIVDTPVLTIPHPEIQNRSFVLWPLADLIPEQTIPTQTASSIGALAQHSHHPPISISDARILDAATLRTHLARGR